MNKNTIQSCSNHSVVKAFKRGGALSLLGIGLCFLACASKSSAQTTNVLSDNFNTYTPGALVGQGGWLQTGSTATNPISVTNPGNAGYVSLTTSGQDTYEPFSTAVTHTVGNSLSTSFSLTLSAALSTGDYFAHLTPTVGNSSTFFERVYAKSSGSGYVLGISGDGSAAGLTYGTTVLSFAAVEQVNVVWNFVGTTTGDTFTLNVNGSAYSTSTWATGTEPTSIAAFNLRQGSATAAPSISDFDNLSDDSTVVPEPATCLAGALMVGAMGWSQRRRVKSCFGARAV